MADKAISELVAAEQIKSTDMFVLEQDGTAKRLQGQTLLNWLTSAADGHGGISDISKTGTDGFVDTYTITLADTTTKTFTVTNGNGLTAFEKLSTVGLVDTYRFTRTDGTYFTFAVANGAKGDTGDAAHVWIKYASQQPTASSHSMGDLPDAWMGVYSGTAAEAPDDWQQYTWYQIKGEKGDTGAAATVTGTTAEYMVSDSGTIVPSGSWSTTIPTVPQGKYLWTRITTTFNTGSPAVSYSVTRMGIDGTGSVSTVNDKSPDESGNVALTAADIATSGGVSVEAKLNTLDEEKQPLLTPGDNISISGGVIATKAFSCNPNMLDNWYFGKPVNQMGQTEWLSSASVNVPCVDRWNWWGQYEAGSTLKLLGDGLQLIGKPEATGLYQAISQKIEKDRVPVGATVTLSALVKAEVDANVLLSVDAQSYQGVPVPANTWTLIVAVFNVPSVEQTLNISIQRNTAGATFTVKAFKLELGSQQTLAHQENGVWVLNEIPDYSEQLRRCQRYQYPLLASMSTGPIGYGYMFNKTQARIFIPTGVPMRVTPVVGFLLGSIGDLYIVSTEGRIPVSSVTVDRFISNIGQASGVVLLCNIASELTTSAVCVLTGLSSVVQPMLDANL